MICRDAAELVSRELDTRLGFAERVGLGVHTMFCGPCRRFRRQLARLNIACCRAVKYGVTPGDESLSPAARARIAAALERLPDDRDGTGLAPDPPAG